MKLGNYPMSRQDNIVVQELTDELLIYDLAKNKALCLNKTSKMIWQACDGTKSVAEISQVLSRRVKSPVSEDFVWLALQQFKKDNLLEKSAELVTPLDGLNRREVVKRIGFASMIALPLISTIIAPRAVNAQSGGLCNCGAPAGSDARPAGCPCVNNNDCCGVCEGGTCGNVTIPSACFAAPCCDFGGIDFCTPTAPPGCDARPAGASCVNNNDCCGVCEGGTCGNVTAPSAPFAKPCCF